MTDIASPEFKYNIVLEDLNESATVIDWGNHPGWIDQYGDVLNRAKRILLVPKQGYREMPVVSVQLGDGKKWILFSRVYGRSDVGLDLQSRVYAIGWQKNISDASVKSITWVYSNGIIEAGDSPSYVDLFFKNHI